MLLEVNKIKIIFFLNYILYIKMPPKKAQAVYKDTPNNRKLNRVGKPFGDPQFKVSKSAPKKPVTEKEDFLDVLSIGAQLGKSKKKSTGVEMKVFESKLKSRINRIGGKISFKLFNEVLDWIDIGENLKEKVIDKIEMYSDTSNFIKQIKPSAMVYSNLNEKQQEKLLYLMAKDNADTFKEHNKAFYEEEIKGNVWTFDTLKKEIKKKYNSQSYPTG